MYRLCAFSGVDTGAVLTACKKHYRGVAKLGVDALVLKTKGFDCKDIAALYHTSSNNVGAWISRAAKKLRSDPDFWTLSTSPVEILRVHS